MYWVTREGDSDITTSPLTNWRNDSLGGEQNILFTFAEEGCNRLRLPRCLLHGETPPVEVDIEQMRKFLNWEVSEVELVVLI